MSLETCFFIDLDEFLEFLLVKYHKPWNPDVSGSCYINVCIRFCCATYKAYGWKIGKLKTKTRVHIVRGCYHRIKNQ